MDEVWLIYEQVDPRKTYSQVVDFEEEPDQAQNVDQFNMFSLRMQHKLGCMH